MSIHKRDGRYQVKWREGDRQRARTFRLKGDADAFETDLRRRKLLGPKLVRELTRRTLTLETFVAGGFRTHLATLAPATRDKYRWAAAKHFGDLLREPLAELDVPRLAEHQRWLLDHGRSPSTVREVMTRLSGILQVATEHGHLTANPCRSLRLVPAEHRDEVTPLSPVELEALIASMKGRSRALCVLAGHLGLRPLEARTVPWSAFDGTTLVIGRTRTKKTAARTRVVAVPRITAAELRAWKLESGGRGDGPIVPMSAAALKMWTKRSLPDGVSLYTLRHSHASALHYAGFTVWEAARRLGHGPQLHVRTYAHVIEGLSGKRYADLDALIAGARGELGFPQRSREAR
jgi:integrase